MSTRPHISELSIRRRPGGPAVWERRKLDPATAAKRDCARCILGDRWLQQGSQQGKGQAANLTIQDGSSAGIAIRRSITSPRSEGS